jgi:hypothetical protein
VLEEVELPVRRRVQVPGEVSLAVQSVMGWSNSHLHEFDIDGRRYGIQDPDWGDQDVTDEAKSKLFRLVGQGARFRYLYDFGDNWAHRLTVEKIAARSRVCATRGVCPGEGGVRRRTWTSPSATTTRTSGSTGPCRSPR